MPKEPIRLSFSAYLSMKCTAAHGELDGRSRIKETLNGLKIEGSHIKSFRCALDYSLYSSSFRQIVQISQKADEHLIDRYRDSKWLVCYVSVWCVYKSILHIF